MHEINNRKKKNLRINNVLQAMFEIHIFLEKKKKETEKYVKPEKKVFPSNHLIYMKKKKKEEKKIVKFISFQ